MSWTSLSICMRKLTCKKGRGGGREGGREGGGEGGRGGKPLVRPHHTNNALSLPPSLAPSLPTVTSTAANSSTRRAETWYAWARRQREKVATELWHQEEKSCLKV
jgi:hypothetical protein